MFGTGRGKRQPGKILGGVAPAGTDESCKIPSHRENEATEKRGIGKEGNVAIKRECRFLSSGGRAGR